MGDVLLAALVLVPPIGRIFGIRLNVDTMGDLERRLGKGRSEMGGHSHGARVWRDDRHGWSIYADGFEYAPHRAYPAQYVEALRLERNGDWSGKVPKVARFADYGVFGRLKPGLSRRAVHAALHGLEGAWTGDLFQQRGRATIRHVTNDESERFTRWRADFTFVRNRLEAVTLDAH